MTTLPPGTTTTLLERTQVTELQAPPSVQCNRCLQRLQQAFGLRFAVIDLGTGGLIHTPEAWLPIDWQRYLPIVQALTRRGRAEIIEACPPVHVLAAPLPDPDQEITSRVAIATFATQLPASKLELFAVARSIGVDADTLYRWCRAQPAWPAQVVEPWSRSICQQAVTEVENRRLKRQLSNVSHHLLQTFEELNLLHRLNDHLCLSNSQEQLLEWVVEWLSDVLPAECLLSCVESTPQRTSRGGRMPSTREWIIAGDCPLESHELDGFFEHAGLALRNSTLHIDDAATAAPNWCYPAVREVIGVPIRIGNEVAGWLLAINCKPGARRRGSDEFGSLETSLLASVASILGMHFGNVRMFRDQEEFFAGMIRALSSAIDAKDPYTRGHSARVARIAVCLARHLGCTQDELNTVYLGGLLHDIGKIGINDQVLRKPGILTAEEFEHVKLHPELGFRILKRVPKLRHVLPVVLHHHEAWDGSGYPGRLPGEETPWLARIVAVADAFDAMSSDRPYRPGMPAGELHAIFRQGAGRQWDPRVIDAFFAVRDEIDAVIQEDREELSLDVAAWQST